MTLDAFSLKIIAARPHGYKIDASFTDTVMENLRKPEILSSAIRNMDVTKKETFMKKLKRLPMFAILAIAIGALLLVSGSAYAAYQLLWLKPTVQISAPSTSQTGRKQVDLLFSDCGATSHTLGYELKKNATITEDQIPTVVQAHCELDAIGAWAMKTFPNDQLAALPTSSEPYNRTMVTTSFATHIKSKDDSAITFVGLTKYMQQDKTFAINDKIRYIVDGHEASINDISLDDPVAYVMSDTQRLTPSGDCTKSCSLSGTPVGEPTLLAIVKLSLPFENYDQFAWQSLAERTACMNNEEDVCLSGYAASIDVYSGAPAATDQTKPKMIEGVITSINGKSTKLRSSSGREFTIITSNDFSSSFNTNRSSGYNNQTIKVGSTLSVMYYEPIDAHNLTIDDTMLSTIQLRIEIVGKSDAPGTY